MLNKKIIAVLAAFGILSSAVPLNISAAEEHTVTVMDWKGNVLDTLTVPHGSELDLSSVDTDSLNSHPDIYTQIGFNAWGDLPKDNIVTEDITVYALFRQMTISCNAFPEKNEYFSRKGKINLGGLDVTITDYTQTPRKDRNGDFIVTQEVTNIESKCTTIPKNIDDAFRDKDSCVVYVYPINSKKPIHSYEITYFDGLGDVNDDNSVEATDASEILYHYAMASIGKDSELTESQKRQADIDRNGIVDATDATQVLAYYSLLSTSKKAVTWDEFLELS